MLRNGILMLLVGVMLAVFSACEWGMPPDETIEAPPHITMEVPETTEPAVETTVPKPSIELPPTAG